MKKYNVMFLVFMLFFSYFVVQKGNKRFNPIITALSQNKKIPVFSTFIDIDVTSEEELIDYFDYFFTGEIVEYLSTSQYDGNGFDIPYTYFSVRCTESFNGDNLNQLETIKYYGGVDEDGYAILNEDIIVPEIGNEYQFLVNRLDDDQLDSRSLEDSLVVDRDISITEVGTEIYSILIGGGTDPTTPSADPGIGGGTDSGIVIGNFDVDNNTITPYRIQNVGNIINPMIVNIDYVYRLAYFSNGSKIYYKLNIPFTYGIEIFSDNYESLNFKLYENSDPQNIINEGINYIYPILFKNINYILEVEVNPDQSNISVMEGYTDIKFKPINKIMGSGSSLTYFYSSYSIFSNKVEYSITNSADKYRTAINNGVIEWNSIAWESFVENNSTPTLKIKGAVDPSDTLAFWQPSFPYHILQINDRYFDPLIGTKRDQPILLFDVICHELGHSLGFAHYDIEGKCGSRMAPGEQVKSIKTPDLWAYYKTYKGSKQGLYDWSWQLYSEHMGWTS
jgi:hypothetical protein